ncbi:MAG: radical SAM protein [Promethearchaeota archaeon]
MEGVYVPSLYTITYKRDGSIKDFLIKKDISRKIRRRWIKDLNTNPCYSLFVTPYTIYKEPTFSIEVTRGCGMHRRFCYMGYNLRKPRRLSIKRIVELIRKGAKLTKIIKLFFEALPRNYTKKLFSNLERLIYKLGIQFRVGSLRADLLTEQMVRVIAKGGQSYLAIAPEVAETKRPVINKKIMDAHIFRAVKLALKYGIPDIHLYLLIGIPTETKEDIISLGNLIKKVRKQMHYANNEEGVLELHINPIYPKPHTPFQWASMESIQTAKDKLNLINKILANEKNIRIRTTINSKTVFSQPIISRGDRRICKVIYLAYKGGNTLEAWQTAFQILGLDPNIYFHQKDIVEKLPWSFIDTCVNESYLIIEWKRANKSLLTNRCGDKNCKRCGVCIEVW